MNPELESEKTAIALSLQQQISNALVNDLAAARIRIRELEAKLAAKTPEPPKS